MENLQTVNIVAVLSVISQGEMNSFNIKELCEHAEIAHLQLEADDDEQTDLT